MATKTVKDEKTADVPAEKNSAKVKTSSVSRYTVDELSKAENEFNANNVIIVQRFQGQTRIYLLWKKLKKLYQNLKTRR